MPPRVACAVALAILGAARARADEEPAPQVTKAPRLGTFVEAEYPPARKAAGETATVVLSIEIGADGKVGGVAVLQTGGADFDAAAVAAARRFLFQPAEVDGKPAPVKITYRYEFRIQTQVVKLGPQVNFDGVVLERFTKRPLPGVVVTLKDTGARTVTDERGRFEFTDVPLGPHKVELSAPTLVTVATEETLVKDVRRTVKYFVEKRDEGIDEEQVVRAARIKKESVETTIRSEEARRVPGTQGDTLKVVQNLPGVARSSFGSGQLVVWGSAPRDTRVTLDGVEVPALYHVGGLRSTINSDLVKSIDLVPGGYGAEYGRGLGGLVRVESRPLPADGVHGYAALDVLDASAMVTAALGKRLRVGLAGRYSLLDRLLPLVTSSDIGDYFPIPRYDDYQARATLALGKDEELSLTFLASDDHLRRSIPSSDPGEVRSENTDRSFYRALLRYARILDDGSSFTVTPSFGHDRSSSSTRFGAVPTRLDVAAWRYGLRAGWRRRVARFATLSAGVDVAGARSSIARAGSINLPPREGDVAVFGQPPGDDVNADDFTTHIGDFAAFAAAELTAGALTVTPGVRADAFLIEGSRLTPRVGATPSLGFTRFEWAVDPRLTVSWRPHRRASLTLAAGLYHQAPEAEELSAVFGNPTLSLSSAAHLSLGASVKLTGTLTAEAVGFYKQLWGLAARSALPTPPQAQALVQEGEGRSYGGQLLVRQELWRGLFGWITYSLSRSERRDHPDRGWRLFDYDQTHVLGIVASYDYKGWVAGVRLRWTSGMPRTPVVGAFFDGRGDQWQPVFGAQNSIRVPDFVQLDLRLEKTFALRRVSLNVFVDVQNVTYRRNPEEIIYNFDFTRRDYITGLPLLAVAGARLQF